MIVHEISKQHQRSESTSSSSSNISSTPSPPLLPLSSIVHDAKLASGEIGTLSSSFPWMWDDPVYWGALSPSSTAAQSQL